MAHAGRSNSPRERPEREPHEREAERGADVLPSVVRRLCGLLVADGVGALADLTVLRLFVVRRLEVLERGPRLARHLEESDAGLARALDARFAELAIDLPGLFSPDAERARGPGRSPSLATWRALLSIVEAPELEPALRDDTTLGWVYQLLNDPRREAIDARIGPRGAVAAHEIATKTQLFTERFMAEWLLDNSVGRLALAMQSAHEEPSAWRPRRAFVSAAAPCDQGSAPADLEHLTLFDPACGAGHLLCAAFDLLVSLYRARASARGEPLTGADIAARILAHNLHGADLDARAVEVTACALYLQARRLASEGGAPLPGEVRVPPMHLAATVRPSEGGAAPNPLAFLGSLLRPEPAHGHEPDPLAAFFDGLASTDDLGVRFDREAPPLGQRLCALLRAGRYDVVVFNPPYLSTAKLSLPPAVAARLGAHPDLFAAFVERALELCKPRGLVAFVALSNWMFLSTFDATRERLLAGHLVLVAELGKGAFRWASKLIQAAMVVASPSPRPGAPSLAARVGSRDGSAVPAAAELAEELSRAERYRPFDAGSLARIEGAPLLPWLDPELSRRLGELPTIADVATGRGGIATGDNERFLRAVWEVPAAEARAALAGAAEASHLPYLKGAEGREWIEPARWLVRAGHDARELRLAAKLARLEPAQALGVAYTTIGHRFAARLHTVASVRDVSGASVFPREGVTAEDLVCALNRTVVREFASALNPTVNFQLGDVRRLPFDRVERAGEIVAVLREAFAEHERGDERSVRFVSPRASAWASACAWAQRAVDRPPGAPLEPFVPTWVAPSRDALVSFALGRALGRFGDGALEPHGNDPRENEEHEPHRHEPHGHDLHRYHPHGHERPRGHAPYLFVSASGPDDLDGPLGEPLVAAWAAAGQAGSLAALRAYLCGELFERHRRAYEGRPIYFALSSARRGFVALASFHAWSDDLLSGLVERHLAPEAARLRRARGGRASRGRLGELEDLITKTESLARVGPPAPDADTPARELDAPLALAQGDGVLVSAAALWPLLEPQWREPKATWRALARGDGRRHYDWSRLAARYFPSRVRARAARDASLAVAHEGSLLLPPRGRAEGPRGG